MIICEEVVQRDVKVRDVMSMHECDMLKGSS
jgi:hypothetical protein